MSESQFYIAYFSYAFVQAIFFLRWLESDKSKACNSTSAPNEIVPLLIVFIILSPILFLYIAGWTISKVLVFLVTYNNGHE